MEPKSSSKWDKALVLGGGISGLISARVLSNYFNKVLILDKDNFASNDNVPRKGVPQGEHIHFLLTSGVKTLDKHFPNLLTKLDKAGATRYNVTESLKWFHHGNWKKLFKSKSELVSYAQTRPFLEKILREEVLNISNIELSSQNRIMHYLYNDRENKIEGVKIRSSENETNDITGDLVVDAMGRSSKMLKWFEDLNLQLPEVETVDVNIKYASAFYSNENNNLNDYTIQAVYPDPPDSSKFGAMADIEGNRILVTLMGIAGDHPETTKKGFINFAKQLDKPYIYNKIKDLEPISEIKSYSYPRMRRYHFDNMNEIPKNFLAIGDALCHFDPLFAQGMTVASLEVDILDQILNKTKINELDYMNKNYFNKINDLLSDVWDIVVMEDTRYNIDHKANLKQKLFQKYTNQIHKLHDDEYVIEKFYRVLNLEKSPYSLMHPKILFKIIKKSIFG